MNNFIDIALIVTFSYSAMLLFLAVGWVYGVAGRRRKSENGNSMLVVSGQQSSDKDQAKGVMVTVLVPARNEEQHILHCLESLAHLNTPWPFEVWVLNDHSNDRTSELVESWIKESFKELVNKMPKGTVFRILNFQKPDDPEGKKAIIEYAVRKSKAPWIAMCDADCMVQPNWLLHMIPEEEDQVSMRCGPVDIVEGGGFIGAYQRSEFLGLMACGAGAIKWGIPLFCNGANLVYSRQDFLEAKGYHGLGKKASGDDELLLWKFKTLLKKKVDFAFHKEAVVRTRPIQGILAFLRQRARWASKTGAYPRIWNTLFGICTYAMNLVLWFCLFLWLSGQEEAGWSWKIPALKLLADGVLFIPVFVWFRSLWLLRWSLVAELFFMCYALVLPLVAPVMNHNWKGRIRK